VFLFHKIHERLERGMEEDIIPIMPAFFEGLYFQGFHRYLTLFARAVCLLAVEVVMEGDYNWKPVKKYALLKT